MKALGTFGATLLVPGCASIPVSPVRRDTVQHAVESDEAGVEGCEFICIVTGQAGGRAKSRRELAFSEIARAAGELGTTHFVVTNARTREAWNFFCSPFCSDKMEVVDKAYRCASEEDERRVSSRSPQASGYDAISLRAN